MAVLKACVFLFPPFVRFLLSTDAQSLGLSAPAYKGVQRMGFKVPTPIQRKAIPIILEGGFLPVTSGPESMNVRRNQCRGGSFLFLVGVMTLHGLLSGSLAESDHSSPRLTFTRSERTLHA